MDDFEEKNKNLDENISNNAGDVSGAGAGRPDNASFSGNYEAEQDGGYHYGRDEIKNKFGGPSGQSDSAKAPPDGENRSYNNYSGGKMGNDQHRGYYQPSYDYQNSQSSYNRPYPYSSYNNADGGDNKKKSAGGKVFAIISSVLCVVLIITLIVVIVGGANKTTLVKEETTGALSENVDEFQTVSSHETDDANINNGELTPKSVYQKVLKSSVGVLVYDKNKALASEGSGVLFQESADGKYTYIITCAHVVAGSSKILIQLYDGSEHEAKTVGFDTRTDIGVLRIEAKELVLADIGDSSKIAVGDTVYAIGNPGGVEFANSFTKGMVSALDRPVNSSSTGYTMECIQHTAAINPGNSGGALVNSYGQIIGINSMKIVADEYEGMGFSVPSSVFVGIVNNIMENGYVRNRPKLGITYVTASEISKYGMFVAIKKLPSGSIVIHAISKDSALAETKAQEGDLIIAVNGHNLDEKNYLPELIEKSAVGDKLTLSLIRIHDDYTFDEFDVTATLVEDRGDAYATQPPEEENTHAPEDFFKDFFDDYFKEFYGGNGRR